ncbi:MAG: threonyl-tRNA synthetase [Amphiamblys sp. WSBS2006]|nr:MAG: threonyl-tRNA synthetase [Amphiamblys sp. WSBS2006]
MCEGCSETHAEKQPSAAMQKRVSLFARLEQEQREEIASKEKTAITITHAGLQSTGTSWTTTPLEILKKAPQKSKPLVSRVDGCLWDLARPLVADCTVEFLSFDDEDGRRVFWHSAAHLLGLACQSLYGAVLAGGPATESGFYYDMQKETAVASADYAAIEGAVEAAIKKKLPFSSVDAPVAVLREMFEDNKYKLHFIEKNIETAGRVYRCGDFVDFCAGPHIGHAGQLGAFKVTKNSSAYFLGDAKNDSLQRVYGVAFPEKKMLAAHLAQLEEAEKRNHIRLGKSLDLFFFDSLSPGSCFFLPHGTKIYNRLVDFLRGEYHRRGFQEVITPNIFNVELWMQSGHWQNYKENMFQLSLDSETFALKPMNCPAHCLMFKSRARSYRDLPIRYADFGVLHRNELSGALSGLTRVRRFQQDDGHIFCAKESIRGEITAALAFLDFVYGKFGFTMEFLLGTRPEKYLGEVEVWDRAEAQLREALDSTGTAWKLNPADGAFYGPKIDIIISDACNRKHQTATIQLDFQLPIRFDLEYTAAEEGETESLKKRPIIIHRAIFGSMERFMAILIETTAGNFPFWLSPRQVAVVPVSKAAEKYAAKLEKVFREAGIDCDADCSPLTLNKKIRNAETKKYFHVVVVGEKEQSENLVNIRQGRNSEKTTVLPLDDAVKMFQKMLVP